jgi:hypothetical protein
VSAVAGNLPFKGGTLVPVPVLLTLNVAALADGSLPLAFPWPGSAPPGVTLVLQIWIADAAATEGAAASNGLQALTP